jgi:hypothetical protein
MDSDKKIVTHIPITNLWTDDGNISVKRERYLTEDDIQNSLKKYPVAFVVANIGEKLEWISGDKSFDFWKSEIKPHLADNITHINLDNYLENYAYVASEWTGEFETPIILLEKYH